MYARGGDHRYREPCRAIVAAAGRGDLAGEASTELIQEYAYVRLRRGGERTEVAGEARAVMALCTAHPMEREDVMLALALLTEHERLHARDAIHAATALRRGISAVVSPDRAFDDVAGLQRIDPRDALGELLS